MDKIRSVISGTPDEEEGGIMGEVNEAMTLSWENRIYAFVGCFLIGLICSGLGSFLAFSGNWTGFALLFSLGSILSIASTCFLMGPFKQIANMFAKKRAIATVVALSMIVLTIVSAVWLHKALLCLIFVILQYAALLWYSLSYIPYARDVVQKCLCSCIE